MQEQTDHILTSVLKIALILAAIAILVTLGICVNKPAEPGSQGIENVTQLMPDSRKNIPQTPDSVSVASIAIGSDSSSNFNVSGTKSESPERQNTSQNNKHAPVNFIPQEGYALIRSGQLFTTSGIENLVPHDPKEEFRLGELVYIYAVIQAPREETVQIKWFDQNDKHILPTAYINVRQNTTPPGYRIYTYKGFRQPGRYVARVYNSTGTQIGETAFRIDE